MTRDAQSGDSDVESLAPLSIEQVDPRRADLAANLLGLQHRAYAVEARLVGFDGIPPLHETLADVMASPLEWHVAWRDALPSDRAPGRLPMAGAIAVSRPAAGRVDIDRLMVDPDVMRRGVGRALVGRVRGQGVATVSTGRANLPAVRLYEALGFRAVEDMEVEPGFWVRRFRFSGDAGDPQSR